MRNDEHGNENKEPRNKQVILDKVQVFVQALKASDLAIH